MSVYNNEYSKLLTQRYQPEMDKYNQQYQGYLSETLSNNYDQFLDEIRGIQILGKTESWNYIGIFTQKDPKESMLSLRKSIDLAKGFTNITGAKIDGPIKCDKFDNIFNQFVLINEKWEILWWYRFSNIQDAMQKQGITKKNENKEKIDTNQINTPMGEYFTFNPQWLEENKESTIELGTAYINQELANIYTMSDNIKALGMMINKYNNKKYLGKMTIPTQEHYNLNAADFAIYYLEKFFKDQEKNLTPKDPYVYTVDEQKKELFDEIIKDGKYQLSGNWKKDEKEIRNLFTRNKNIFWNTKRFPWMFGTYLGMSSEFTYHGSIKNPDGTIEAGITIDTDTISDDFRDKYIETTKETVENFQDPKDPSKQITFWEYLEQKQQGTFSDVIDVI